MWPRIRVAAAIWLWAAPESRQYVCILDALAHEGNRMSASMKLTAEENPNTNPESRSPLYNQRSREPRSCGDERVADAERLVAAARFFMKAR